MLIGVIYEKEYRVYRRFGCRGGSVVRRLYYRMRKKKVRMRRALRIRHAPSVS